MTEMDYTKLSKAISHALRHEPWLYELEFDDQGFGNPGDPWNPEPGSCN